jgi:hypothetical protein
VNTTGRLDRAARRLLAGALLATLLTLGVLGLSAHAQGGEPTTSDNQVKVLIDKDRNAVIETGEHKTVSDGASGSANLGTDLGAGLSTLNVDMTMGPAEAAKMKGAKVTAYGQIDTNGSTILGNFTVPVGPEAQKAKLTADAKAQQNDKNFHIDMKVNGQVPNTEQGNAPLTHLGIDLETKTDYSTINSDLKVEANSATMKQIPVRNLSLTITEPDANTTNLDLQVTLDMQSQYGQNLKPMLAQIKANPQQFTDRAKQMLSAYGVDTVTLTADDQTGKVALTLKANGLRQKISQAVAPILGTMPNMDPNVAKQSLDNLLALTISKLSITADAQNDALKASLSFEGKNFDKFFAGYTALIANMQETQFKRMQARSGQNPTAGLALKWYHAVQTKLNDMSNQVMAEMVADHVNVTQSLKLTVDVKDQINIDGSYVQDAQNFDKVYQALKAKGFPVVEGGGLLAHFKMDGTANATGSFFASAKGNLPQLAKTILVDPAKQDPDLKPAADLLSNNVNWQDGRIQLQVNDNKVQATGYVKTSDLTPLIAAIQMKSLPTLTGTPVGARVEATEKDGKSDMTLRIGYKQFETGKSDDDVKQAVSTMFSGSQVTVTNNAEASQVALAKLDQPKVEMPAELASVKSEGETVIASVPAPGETAGGPSAGGMNKGVLIGIGVAVLALLGIVMASAGKKR